MRTIKTFTYLLLTGFMMSLSIAFAATTSASATQITTPTAPSINARGYILMDAQSGEILAQQNADVRMQPASLTKLMTMYIISNALKSGKIHLTDSVSISKTAWKTGGSRMFVQVNTQVPVQALVDGIVVASGNDAAVAMAEYIGGTEENFVATMNQSAAQLGMRNSHFMDVNGLPATNHYSSPRDLALLTRALIEDFPEYYPWYAQKWMEYNKIKQPNRNKLLWRDASVDGLKTGFTDAAGYCLVASAQRNGMRLISVVMGAPSSNARIDATEALLNWGFRHFSTHQLYAANQPLAQSRVWYGSKKTVPLGVAQPLTVTIPSQQYQNLKALLTVNNNLQAPIVKGQSYGKIDVMLNNQLLRSVPVIALANNPRGNIFERTYDKLILFFHNV